MRIYQAGPLFSEAECNWHKQFKEKLESSGYEVVWPGELITSDKLEAWGNEAARKIMETDRDALLSCDVVVALLDGTQVDDGTAWEIGFACAKGIPVIGIRTDFRHCGDTDSGKVNAMIQGSVCCIVKSGNEVLDELRKMRFN